MVKSTGFFCIQASTGALELKSFLQPKQTIHHPEPVKWGEEGGYFMTWAPPPDDWWGSNWFKIVQTIL